MFDADFRVKRSGDVVVASSYHSKFQMQGYVPF